MIKAEGLACPKCSRRMLDVIETRPRADGQAIRRRRVCQDCGDRVTTYETVSAPVGDNLTLTIALADELRDTQKRLTKMIKGLNATIAEFKARSEASTSERGDDGEKRETGSSHRGTRKRAQRASRPAGRDRSANRPVHR